MPHNVNGDGPIPDRLTLQRYMRSVIMSLSTPNKTISDRNELAKARVQLERFLLDQPVNISMERRKDLLRMASRDDDQLDEERRLWLKAGKRARELRTVWNQYRDALIGGDELDRSFALLKRFDHYKKLPVLHQDAEEWARIWVAYTMQ